MKKDNKMKGDEKLCLNVNDLRALARVNEIALKLKEMERLLKIRKDENNEMKKEELMNQRLEKIKKKLKKIINERYGIKNE